MENLYRTKFPLNEKGFGNRAKVLLQVEMKRREIGYRELTSLINEKFGQGENEKNVRNKVARGTFSAGFFLMALLAIDATTVSLSANELMAQASKLHPDGT